MSEPGDFSPADWAGHDFKSARKAYDKDVGRGYADAVAAGKTASDLLPESLSTDSPSPMVIVIDETGSMGAWPATMFSKLPWLELECQEYLGKDMEVSFAAFGDATGHETYPVQARPFTKGTDELKACLKELVIEAAGGGQLHESSELTALYYARNVSMPNAIQPVYIFITDELPYEDVTKAMALQARVQLEGKRITTAKIFEELKAKFSVYLILKPYNVDAPDNDRINAEVRNGWLELVDMDHTAFLPDANRVVDVIFGILAKETGRVDYFKKELVGRQDPGQVATVYKSLNTIHALAAPTKAAGKVKQLPAGGKSTMHRPGGGKKSGDLL